MVTSTSLVESTLLIMLLETSKYKILNSLSEYGTSPARFDVD